MSDDAEKNEKYYQEKIYDYLNTNFSNGIKIDKENLNLDMEVPVPYGFSFSPKSNITEKKMIIYCYNQDICFFKELFDKKDKEHVFLSTDMKKSDNEKLQVRIESNFPKENKSKKVGIPFVILEVKLQRKDKNKESPTTGDIIAYNNKAQDIKSIFPFVQYGFVVVGEIPPRVYQHGYAFDAIIPLTYEEIENNNFNKSFMNKTNEMLSEAIKRFKGQYK